MKIPKIVLSTKDKLREFDVWITPSLGDIRDTVQFQSELANIADTFELMGKVTSNFADPTQCDPQEIASAFIQNANQLDFAEASSSLAQFASILFLVTGKSDNNAKCQLPLYLRDTVKLSVFPSFTKPTNKKNPIHKTADGSIPRVLPSQRYMDAVAALKKSPKRQAILLDYYIKFLLSDETYVSQLWSIGHSFFALKSFGKEKDFLGPLVAFKVRGSVAATGGHDPETLLRARLAEWGLNPNIDYNSNDVTRSTIKSLVGAKKGVASIKKTKSRAYDFVLPFATEGRFRRVCVQSQFYAGDSGSVSHKNVDQTATSRNALRAVIPDAVLVEYVDGAGYFSSLNGDLEKLLDMEGTEFSQIRSSPIRLRREIQHSGFLMPLEIQQATFQTSRPTRANVAKIAVKDGYTTTEFSRSLSDAMARGLIIEDGGLLRPRDSDRDTVRRYVLLDVAAISGIEPKSDVDSMAGAILVPGFGPFHGIKLDELVKQAKRMAPGLASEIGQSELLMADLRWLSEQRIAMV